MDFRIPEQNLSVLITKLQTLVKAAQKLGVEEPKLVIGSTDVVEDKETGEVQAYVNITVEGGTAKLNGYTAVAALDRTDSNQSLIRRIDGSDEPLPTEFREYDPGRCDHCNRRRNRIRSYVLKSDDGRMLQVGSACVKDFTGHADPLRVAAFFENLYALLTMARDRGNGERNPYAGTIFNVLALTATYVRVEGWLSKTKWQEQGQVGLPTAHRVINHLTSRSRESLPRSEMEDSVKAEQSIEWVKSLSQTRLDGNDYLHNIRVIADTGVVRWEQMGFACSILAAYLREASERAERATKLNEYVGSVGQRLKLELTCLRVRHFDSDFGRTFIYAMEDDAGRAFVWFTGNGGLMSEGEKVSLNGTVKLHDEYNGRKQTTLTRCKVLG